MDIVLRKWFPKDIATYIDWLTSYNEWRQRIQLVNKEYMSVLTINENTEYIKINGYPYAFRVLDYVKFN